MNAADIPDTDGRTVATTETSFRIIEALKRRDGAGVTELATELDIAKGTVYKHLNTLRGLDYVLKDGDTYCLSVGFLGLGVAARARLPIHDVAEEPIRKLAETTGETASLMIPEHGYGVYAMRIVPEGAPDPLVNEGDRVPLHATAGGKAILAELPETEVEHIFDVRGLGRETEATVTDRDALRAELQMIHDRRSAYDREELAEGLHCVAAPIVDEDGRAIGAVTISGTAERFGENVFGSDITSFMGSTADSIQNRLRSR